MKRNEQTKLWSYEKLGSGKNGCGWSKVMLGCRSRHSEAQSTQSHGSSLKPRNSLLFEGSWNCSTLPAPGPWDQAPISVWVCWKSVMLREDPRPNVAFGNIWGGGVRVRGGVSNHRDFCYPDLCLPSRSPSPWSLFLCEVREE